MTAEQFNGLNEEDKKVAIFEARKVTEFISEINKVELFQIGDFFIESRTTPQSRTKRCIRTYSKEEVPDYYSNLSS